MGEMTVTRVFDAPRELVWKAWTEPEQFASWFGTPPYTTPPATVTMDVRPGGKWAATMVHETDGTELPFRGEYREVVEPERLVMAFEDTSDESSSRVEVLTVTFTDLGGKTEIVAHQAGSMPGRGVQGARRRLWQLLRPAREEPGARLREQ